MHRLNHQWRTPLVSGCQVFGFFSISTFFWDTLYFEIAYIAGAVLEMCLELSQAVWSNSKGSQLELIGIEYYSSPIQGKHNVCQDEGWWEISEDVCKKYILAKWQFVGATGKIIDHVHFPISRRGGSLNDPSFQYRQLSFSSGHGQRYSMVGETFCIFYIMVLRIILFKVYEN